MFTPKTHAVNPFKQPLVEDEEEEENKQNEQASNGAKQQQHVSASGPRRYFSRLLPDTQSRYAFIFVAIAAIAISTIWLINTIQSKWVYGLAHPLQSVTYERVSSLPALLGMALTYPNSSIAPDASLYRSASSWFHGPGVPPAVSALAQKYINCNETNFYFPMAFCQPCDVDGVPVFKPVPGELDGASANRDSAAVRAMEAWPLQFRGSTDALCFFAFLVLNLTAFTLSENVPRIDLVPLSAAQSLATQELVRANITSSTNPAVLDFIQTLPAAMSFPYNSKHNIQMAATRVVQADGSESLEYSYSNTRDLIMSDSFLSQGLGIMMAGLNGTDPAEYARVQGLLGRPGVQFFFNQLCFLPASFNIQVITQTHPYNWLAFLSDLGGFANLVTVAVLFLFPLAYQATQPRSFLLFFLADKWKARKGEKQQHQQQQQHDAGAAKATKPIGQGLDVQLLEQPRKQ